MVVNGKEPFRLEDLLRKARPNWGGKDLQAVQEKLGKVGVFTVAELNLALREDELNRRLVSAGLKAFSADTVSALEVQLSNVGPERLPKPDRPATEVLNVSGVWLVAREDDPGTTIWNFHFHQFPNSEQFDGPGVKDGRVNGDLIQWRFAKSSCRGRYFDRGPGLIVNIELTTAAGRASEAYAALRLPDTMEKMTLHRLVAEDTRAAMLSGAGALAPLALPGDNEVAVVTTVPHRDERLRIQPPLELKQEEPGLSIVLTLDPNVRYQRFLGFGGSFTESAAVLWLQLSSTSRSRVIDACFSRGCGLGYRLGRLHVNSCDFSQGNWSCCDQADLRLESFSVERYERAILPMMRQAAAATDGEPLKLLASPWSPPAWMKDTREMIGGNLRPDCREVWARFYVRFARELESRGFPLWAMTVQNEPENTPVWESCCYSAQEEAAFVRDFLGPAIEVSGLDLKLLIWDHNRDEVYRRARVVLGDPGAARHVWGTAFHWYGDPNFEQWPDVLGQVCFENVQRVHELCPEKHLIMSEACQEGAQHLGEWRVGERYAHNILQDLSHWTEAWIDWNLLLDEQGGPNHARNFCSAPIIVDAARDLVLFQPCYYYIAHFSRHILPGAQRILSVVNRDALEAVAFANPDSTIVAVVLNRGDRPVEFSLEYGCRSAQAFAHAHSIQTLVLRA